jgi:hypothetical protein
VDAGGMHTLLQCPVLDGKRDNVTTGRLITKTTKRRQPHVYPLTN